MSGIGGTPWWSAVVDAAAALCDVRAAHRKVLSDGRRATIALIEAEVVVRARAADADPGGLIHELEFAQLSADHAIPVIEPAHPELIWTADGAAASVWPLLDTDGADTADWRWLGEVAAAVEQLPAASLAFRSDPVGRIIENLSVYEHWPAASPVALDLARTRLDEMRRLLEGIVTTAVVVHGDLHPRNVVVSRGGPILIDFDLAGVGLPNWDASIAALFLTHFGLRTTDFRQFIRGLGRDPRDDPTFSILTAVQELLCISYVMRRVAESAPAHEELARRIRRLEGRADTSRWHAIDPA